MQRGASLGPAVGQPLRNGPRDTWAPPGPEPSSRGRAVGWGPARRTASATTRAVCRIGWPTGLGPRGPQQSPQLWPVESWSGFKSHTAAFWDRAGQNAPPQGEAVWGQALATRSSVKSEPPSPQGDPRVGLHRLPTPTLPSRAPCREAGQGAGRGDESEVPGLRAQWGRGSLQAGSRPCPSAGAPRHVGKHPLSSYLVTICPGHPVSSPGGQWGDGHYPSSGGRNCSHRGQGQDHGHCGARPQSPTRDGKQACPQTPWAPRGQEGPGCTPARCPSPGITWPGEAPSLH